MHAKCAQVLLFPWGRRWHPENLEHLTLDCALVWMCSFPNQSQVVLYQTASETHSQKIVPNKDQTAVFWLKLGYVSWFRSVRRPCVL